MPAVSKSQQRLFGMVHAYNKGELRAGRRLTGMVARLSEGISDEDARHFAKTKHDGLPEKKAQAVLSPDQVRALYGSIPKEVYSPSGLRSRKRRTLLGHLVGGAVSGAIGGGLGFGALGAFLANRAISQGHRSVAAGDVSKAVLDAGLRCGTWGAIRGAGSGALLGGGLYMLGNLSGGDD